jgi:hypothetical protein
MTMHHHDAHPDEERLAALAGGEADEALVAHLASCSACRDAVSELQRLRLLLAELPDVVPPRPLRLLPPLQEGPPRTLLRLLRGLAAPALAAGIALAVIGGAGSVIELGPRIVGGGAATAGQYEAGAPAAMPSPASDEAAGGGRAVDVKGSAAPQPAVDGAREAADLRPLLWPLILVLGVVLLGVGLLLRFALQPRAG